MKTLSEKDKQEISKPYTGHVAMWRRTSFWENVKRTLALGGGGATFSLSELGAADQWVWCSIVISFLIGGVSIWFTDHDNNGIVDLFQ